MTKDGSPLVELLLRRRLVRADAAGGDVGHVIVLAAHGGAGESTQESDLADMPDRVGDRALKELLLRTGDRLGRSEPLVETRERGVKARGLVFPGKRLRALPDLLAARMRQRPVEQIPDVRQD